MLVPVQALLFYMYDGYKIIGTAEESNDGLFYISDCQEKLPKPTTKLGEKHLKAMKAVGRNPDRCEGHVEEIVSSD